jgi:hypothetical protein
MRPVDARLNGLAPATPYVLSALHLPLLQI